MILFALGSTTATSKRYTQSKDILYFNSYLSNMQENRITIIIDKPIEKVFEFTTNPENTHLWVPFIEEEIAEEFPPKIGTVYKNRRGNSRNISKVTEYETNKVFKLENKTFSVRYIFKKINKESTELIYIESVKKGELAKPFTKEVLQKLKLTVENL